MNDSPLSIVVLGHVDHGKSSLIGRILCETDCLPPSRKDEAESASLRRGDHIEYSYLLDIFQAERDQAVTIDTTQIPFKTAKHDYVIIDAPGHREFIKNMVSGAAQADAAILVIDVTQGVQEQTERHASILPLLGISDVVVAVNKMDAVSHDENRFNIIRDEINAFLHRLDIQAKAVIPLSAKTGEMIAARGNAMNWYQGDILTDILDRLPSVARGFDGRAPLRLGVQDIYRQDGQRIIVGRVNTGSLRVNDTVLISPSNEVAKITSIMSWPQPDIPAIQANSGESTAITLDRPVFIERGHIISHQKSAPIMTSLFRVRLFWLDRHGIDPSRHYRMHIGPLQANIAVRTIESAAPSRDDMADIVFKSAAPLSLDHHQKFVLYDGHRIVAFGRTDINGFTDQRPVARPNLFPVAHLTDTAARAVRNGHKGGVFWLTGLSASGKSTLAMMAERILFDKGYQVYVLDGDNIRRGLNVDLGFSDADRTENIRRIGEVAALMADAGMIVITAFISPFRQDRDHAKQAAQNDFHEIHIKADLKICESRDPKGLYAKARRGDIRDFTGIDSPYEPPENADLVIPTDISDIPASVAILTDYIEKHTALRKEPRHVAL